MIEMIYDMKGYMIENIKWDIWLKWYMIWNDTYDRNDIWYEMIYMIENMKWCIWYEMICDMKWYIW